MKHQKDIFQKIYFFGLIMIAVGLPLSLFLISLAQIIVLGAWLFDGDLKTKLSSFRKNKAALILTSIFALHLVGLLYTSNFTYAFNDIKIKLPLLILPLVISTMPTLSRRQFHIILLSLIGAVLVSTLVSTAVLLGFSSKVITDIRKISLFISHIRLSLLICVSACCLIYFIEKVREITTVQKIIYVLIFTWFVTFLFILQAATGLIILSILLLYVFIKNIKHSNNVVFKRLSYLTVTLIIFTFVYFLFVQVQSFYEIKSFPGSEHTLRGNNYDQNIYTQNIENGFHIGQYNCWIELEEEWQKRSSLDYHQKDLKGQDLRFTLVRYLTSKGLKKDAEGMAKLTGNDIKAIELGTTNFKFTTSSGLNARVYQIIWELNNYRNGGKPNGHSVTMRFEFWKTAVEIIKENIFMGVGTGDVQQAFNDQYEKSNTQLDKEWRLRAHNQFLTIWITFGIGGFLIFITSLIFPFFTNRKVNFLYVSFFIIAALSMISEDTLETSTGATFFAFFNSLLFFQLQYKRASKKTFVPFRI